MKKKDRAYLAQVLFAARLSLILLVGVVILEIFLVITANMGAVWNNELRLFTLESIYLILVFLSAGTMILSVVNKKILFV